MTLEQSEFVKVLVDVRALLARAGNDFVGSRWDDAAQATSHMDTYISAIRAGTFPDRKELELLFAPTGSLQEVSLNSGWDDEFIAVSQRFDHLVEKLYRVS